MEVENVTVRGTWREVADAARTTVGLEKGKGEPPSGIAPSGVPASASGAQSGSALQPGRQR